MKIYGLIILDWNGKDYSYDHNSFYTFSREEDRDNLYKYKLEDPAYKRGDIDIDLFESEVDSAMIKSLFISC